MISICSPKSSKLKGLVFYDGPSLIDGKPILGIATGFQRTNNPKTGNMIQTWIIPKKQSPTKAIVEGKDVSICGDCKHRSKASGGWGTCYVSVYYGPYNIYKAYKRGSYEIVNALNMNAFRDRHIRIGSYGDPAAIPYEVWEKICSLSKGFTGYTHQWHRAFCDQRLKKICMASVDTVKEAQRARSKGWKTFRIQYNDETMDNEIHCPASKEMGNKTTCERCGICSGLGKPNVAIKFHGYKWKEQLFKRIMTLRKQKKAYRHLIKG